MLGAEWLHGDDTRLPVLAEGKMVTGRIWTHVRDDKPFAGQAPPGAIFYYSRDRRGEQLYDFGDGWERTIMIERFDDPKPGVLYPQLTEAKGRCPPEDVGGPWGYAEFLEALKDPGHERHADMIDWLGVGFLSSRRRR